MKLRAALPVLGLALAILSPAPASADAGCTKRALSGTISATVSLTPATGSFEGHGSGFATHLGRFTASQQGTVGPTPSGSYAGRSTWTIVAANGDTLTGTATLAVEGAPTGQHTTTMTSTVTGGTGRFADATGGFTIVFHVTPVAFDGVTAVNRAEGPIRGHIRY